MNLYPKNKLPLYDVQKFIIIFYLVGISGFLLPFSNKFFIQLTPFALVLCIYLLAIYHKKYTKNTLIVFATIFSLGFFVEIIGVQTGLIFGDYVYGASLGFKILNTPLLIGANWLFLSYTSVSIVKQFIVKDGFVLFLAPLLMLVYDFVLEQVAPKMDMWSWQNDIVPIANYVAWYIIAFVFVFLIQKMKIDTKNPLAAILFFSQFVFFVLLALLLNH